MVLFDALRALLATLALGLRRPALAPVPTKRTALATEMPNRSAAARRDIPPSTARTVLIRKSSDKGLAMRAGLLVQHTR